MQAQAIEKVTFTLPVDIMQQVRELAPSRGHSKFVAEALSFFIEQKRREALRAELIAGYQSTADEAQSLNREFEAADQHDWDHFVPAYDGEEPLHDAIR